MRPSPTPFSPSRCGFTRPAAFTLVETLVAASIIGIMLGLALVAFGPQREKAQQVSCIGRLRQLGVALQLYANDNQGQFLQPKNDAQSRWPILLAPYLGLEKLPVSQLQKQPILRDPTQSRYTDARGIFGYNMILEASDSTPDPVRIHALTAPSSFPVLATTDGSASGGQRLSRGGPPEKATNYGYTGKIDKFGPSPNFGSRAAFLFGDWHVELREVCDSRQWPWNDPQAFLPR